MSYYEAVFDGGIYVLLTDLRYALRMMRRTPMFTAAVVLTVALAIGANTAIFSVVNAVMLRPLPFGQPDQVIQIGEKNDKLNLANYGASALNYLSWKEQTHAFQEIAALGYATFTITGSGEPEQVSGNRLTSGMMRVLGLNAVAGRVFNDDEDKPGAAPVAIIGEGLWKRRFGKDPAILGRTITIDGSSATVIGIAPPGMYLFGGGEVFIPLIIDPSRENRLNHVISVFGRLAPGVSLQDAKAEMDTISTRVGQQFPEVRDWSIQFTTLLDTFVTPDLKTGLIVLIWAVAFVLLIACANIANLLLARAAAREVEMAMRTAMGANRRRLLIQSLVESITLSAFGGIIGIAAGLWAVHVSGSIIPPDLLPTPDIPVDARVLAFAAGITVLTGLLFGIAPALRSSKADLNHVLKQTGRGSTGKMRARFRDGLAAVELALAAALLVGAGLLIQSLVNLKKVNIGFEPHGVITFQLAPPTAKYPTANGKAALFYRNLLESLQTIPGVRGAGLTSGVPFDQANSTRTPMEPVGQSALPVGAKVPLDWRIISPGFFKTMNIPLQRGRDFTDADGPSAPLVTIISQAAAKKFWGDSDPIGRSVHRAADTKTSFTVVGIVGDVHNSALNLDFPSLYYPMAWRVGQRMNIVVRTDGSPEAMLPMLRQKVHELDPELGQHGFGRAIGTNNNVHA